MKERRYPRVPVTIPVRLRHGRSGLSWSGEIADLSLGGCFVRVEESPPLGSTVELEFDLRREERTVRIEGKVIHSLRDKRSHRGYGGIGIEFTRLEDEAVELLWQVVQDRTEDPYGST